MPLILNDQHINNTIKTVIQYFEIMFNEKINDINIYPSDDVDEDTSLFIVVKEKLKMNPNGRFIEPNEISPNSTILIKYDLFYKDGYPAISTLIHELTHTSDYKKFCNEYCNGNWSSIREQPIFNVMYYWSEYHARITQIIHMRVLLSIILSDESIAEKQSVKEEFLKYQFPRYKQELISALNSNNDVFDLVEIFKYCARFYICQYYNNELKIEEHIPECVFKYFPDIIKLYYDLLPMQSYEDASKNFKYLSLMLWRFS